MKAEPSRLREMGCDGEAGAGYAEVAVLEVLRSHDEVRCQGLAQPRQHGAVQGVDYPFLKPRSFNGPVDVGI